MSSDQGGLRPTGRRPSWSFPLALGVLLSVLISGLGGGQQAHADPTPDPTGPASASGAPTESASASSRASSLTSQTEPPASATPSSAVAPSESVPAGPAASTAPTPSPAASRALSPNAPVIQLGLRQAGARSLTFTDATPSYTFCFTAISSTRTYDVAFSDTDHGLFYPLFSSAYLVGEPQYLYSRTRIVATLELPTAVSQGCLTVTLPPHPGDVPFVVAVHPRDGVHDLTTGEPDDWPQAGRPLLVGLTGLVGTSAPASIWQGDVDHFALNLGKGNYIARVSGAPSLGQADMQVRAATSPVVEWISQDGNGDLSVRSSVVLAITVTSAGKADLSLRFAGAGSYRIQLLPAGPSPGVAGQPTVSDAHGEPNDAPLLGAPINAGQTISATVAVTSDGDSRTTDTDWYRFRAPAGAGFRITIAGGPLPVSGEAREGFGNIGLLKGSPLLASCTGAQCRDLRFSESYQLDGWYYVGIRFPTQASTSTYRITLTMLKPYVRTSTDDPADVNGDGHGDVPVLETSEPSDMPLYWMASAPGPVLTPHWLGSRAARANWVGIAPMLVNDGGYPLLTRDTSGRLWMHTTAIASAARQVGSGWGSMKAMVPIPDTNGNGRPELLAVQSDGKLIRYEFIPKVNGLYPAVTTLVRASEIGSGWAGFVDVFTAGDLDGNGIPDLIARTTTGELKAYFLGPRGTFIGAPKIIGTGWTSMKQVKAPADINGDGTRDLVAVKFNGEALVYYRKGSSFSAPVKVSNDFGTLLIGC